MNLSFECKSQNQSFQFIATEKNMNPIDHQISQIFPEKNNLDERLGGKILDQYRAWIYFQIDFLKQINQISKYKGISHLITLRLKKQIRQQKIEFSQISVSELKEAFVQNITQKLSSLQNTVFKQSQDQQRGLSDWSTIKIHPKKKIVQIFDCLLELTKKYLIEKHQNKSIYRLIDLFIKPEVLEQFVKIFQKVVAKIESLEQYNKELFRKELNKKISYVSAEAPKIIRIDNPKLQINQEKTQLEKQNEFLKNELASDRKVISLQQQALSGYKKKLDKEIAQKQSYLEALDKLEEIVNQQMSLLQFQDNQLVEKEKQIRRYQMVQQELMEQKKVYELYQIRCQNMEKIVNELKQTQDLLGEKTDETKSYYINPYYEKNAADEKMLVEIIELQADLLNKKQQNQKMIDAIVSIIKIFHQVIEDFQNNSLLTNNYRNRYADRFVIDILREISSFDKLDLDSIFSIRDESNSSSQFSCSQLRSSMVLKFNGSEMTKDDGAESWTEDQSLKSSKIVFESQIESTLP